MPTRSALSGLMALLFVLAATFGAQVQPRQVQPTDPALIAHEWGTFTSIAGGNGRAANWSPLNGSAELPSFVEHFNNAQYKEGLRGTVRMETPVLYFYSPRETEVSVKVAFSKGVLTEWYPHASRIEPDPRNVLHQDGLLQRHASGSIAWNSVTVSPNIAGNYPGKNGSSDEPGNQYYAARETSAAPLVVKTEAGDQQEKFLFYRGVSTFSTPISATVSSDGEVRIANLAGEEIPSVILLERRGDKLGYRLGGALQNEMSLEPPELTATVDSMSRDLQDILTGQGLYPDEAHAMIETWRQSWFEQGSRLFYIVPKDFLKAILPITINPAPSQTVRVFVGRLELLTPATAQELRKILTAHDMVSLGKYTRFLEPFLQEMKDVNPAQAAQIERDLDRTYRSPAVHPPTAK